MAYVDNGHGLDVQAVDVGAAEADHKALQLLLVQRKLAGFDVELAAAAKAQHILVLGVPSHRVGVGLLVQQLLGDDIVHQASIHVVDHGQLASVHAQVQAADGDAMLDHLHREGVVEKELQHLPVLQPHQQAYATAMSTRPASLSSLPAYLPSRPAGPPTTLM